LDPLSIICARISASLTAEGDVSPEAPPAAFAGMAQVGISELPTLKRVTRETPSPPPQARLGRGCDLPPPDHAMIIGVLRQHN
jgi:hypothetical protein